MKNPAHLILHRLASCAFAVVLAVLLSPAAFADNDKPDKKSEAGKEKKPAAEAREKAEAKPKGKPKERPQAKPASNDNAKLETRTFKVAPDFFRVSADSAVKDPFADSDGTPLIGIRSARHTLEELGIVFGPGASAVYNRGTLQMVVRNTVQQLDLIAAIVAHVDASREKQVHIIWEMIEVEHADFSDWLFDHRLNSDGTELRKWAQQKIDDGDGMIIESALVTARSGQRAKAESIHEFIYPTEMDPPEVPNEVILKGKAEAPITAVSPTAYETRNVGTTIEVDPVIGADNTTIDLNLAPEKVQLEGYTIWPHEDIEPLFKQQMPTFYTMRITTQVALSDGNYAFLGTLRPLHNSVEDIEDPIVLSFVRADVGIVPLPRPRQADKEEGKRKGGH